MNPLHDLCDRGGVEFRAEDHVYMNPDGVKYRSVTNLLGDYKTPFDADRMSKYKAIKDTLDAHTFHRLKVSSGGWEFVADQWNALLRDHNLHSRLLQSQSDYLQKWSSAGKDAANSGTDEHSRREAQVLESGFIIWGGIEYHYDPSLTILDVGNTAEPLVLVEALLWNHELKIAGLSDLLFVKDGVISIGDYKSNKEITRESFGGKTMLPPLQNLPDSNYWHYSLQLGLYQRMACDLSGLEFGDLTIIQTANPEYGRQKDVILPLSRLTPQLDLIYADLGAGEDYGTDAS